MTKKVSEPKIKTKKRRLWLKIPLYTLLFIIIVIACLPLYSFLFISTITDLVEQNTGRKASLDALSINAFAANIYIENLQLKEKDSTENFVKIDKMDFDVSVISLLFGNIELVHGEISGVNVKVVKNSKGDFNFKSILDALPKENKNEPKTTPKTTTKIETPSKPLESLPYLGAKVIVKDVNFSYEDVREKTSFDLAKLNFTCNIAGLDKIGYQSDWKSAQYNSKKNKETSAGVVYRLNGSAGVGIKNGKWFASSKGDLLLSDIYANGFGEKNINKTSLKIDHDFSLDLEKGVCEVKNINVDCDYVTFKVSQTKIDNLQQIQDNVPTFFQNKDFKGLKSFIAKLPIEGWSGDITATVDIDQIKQDFGKLISTASKEQLTDFGGKISFHAKLQGKESIFSIEESLNVDNLYLAGSLPEAKDSQSEEKITKPYRVGLKSITQVFNSKINFREENISSNINLDIVTLDSQKLMHAHLDNVIKNIFDPTNIRVEKYEDKLMLDFDVLSTVIKDFLPKDTALKGKMENTNMLTFSPEKGISIGGDTIINAKVISPKVTDLPELKLKGERNIEVGMVEGKVQKIVIKKLDMKTLGSDIFILTGKGLLNLDGDNKEGLQLDLSVNLDGLQKYIEPLAPNVGVQGKILHKTTLAQKGDKVRLEGNGSITSVIVSLGEGTIPYDIPKAYWKHDVIATLENNEPRSAQVRAAFAHPALSVNVLGELSDIKNNSFKLDKFKANKDSGPTVVDGMEIEIESDFAKIPFFAKKIIAESGLELTKLEGKFKNTTTISGEFNDLKIKNQMNLKSDISIALKENKDDVETLSPPIDLKQGIDSNILIAIRNAGMYQDKKSAIEVSIHPKSFFNLQYDNSDLVAIQFKGTITKDQEKLNIDGLEIVTSISGSSIQSSIPVDFIARDNKELKETFNNLKLDGNMILTLQVNGAPDNLQVSFKEDLTPFIVKLKDAKKGMIINKDKNFTLSYEAKIHLENKEDVKKITMSNTPKFGMANISMEDLFIEQSEKALHVTAKDGKSKARILTIEQLSFGELSKILPIIKTLKLDNSLLDLNIQDVIVHTDTKDFSGKLLCHILVPEMDMPHIQKTLGGKTTSPVEQKTPKVNPNKETPVEESETEKEVVTLSQEVRDMLKKLGIEVQVNIEKMQLDPVNKAEDLRVDITMNQNKPDNQFLFDVNGKTNTGTLKITAKADLDKEHPKCSFKSDIDEVPYVATLFAPISDNLNEVVKFPLFQKIDFGDPQKITFSLKGENTWTGLDPRVIKKSLFSAGETSLTISGGKFDLGFDMTNFINADELMKKFESQLSPLKNSLSQLTGQSNTTKSQIGGVESSIAKLDANIQPVINQKTSLENTIKQTKSQLDSIGFDFGGVLKKSLEKSQSLLSSYDAQIATYEQEKSKLQTSLQSFQAELAKMQGEMGKLQNDIKAKQNEFMSKMKIDNPFSFDFGALYIAFKVTNDSPYGGVSSDWSPHPFSRVNYVEVSFSPKDKTFPAIKGWYGLDGGFNFNFLPAAEQLENLRQKAPWLADFITKKDGVAWGSEGFQPSGIQK